MNNLQRLHSEIVKADREHHMRSIGGHSWVPSHRVKYPKTGPRDLWPVNETVEEME